MKQVAIVYAGMLVLAWAWFSLILGGCIPNGPGSPYISTEVPTKTPTPAQVEITVEAELHPTPAPRDLTFVILGLDRSDERCTRNERCWQMDPPHSDVFVIARVQGNEAVVVLVPRSLYVPNVGFEMWSMSVYGRRGADGIKEYVQTVFGLEVDGVLAIDMSQFASLIDKMGGLEVSGAGPLPLSGIELLAYLRDNENNWGCSTYDCEGRIFKVATALRSRSADLIFWTLGADGLYEMDLTFSDVLGYLHRYYEFNKADGTVRFVRLWRPDPLETNNTPLEIRGLVPVRPLYEWMQEVLQTP